MTVGIAQQTPVVVISGTSVNSLGAYLPDTPTAGNMLVYFAAIDKGCGTITDANGFVTRSSIYSGSASFLIATKIAVGDEDETNIVGPTWATGRNTKAWVMELASSTGGTIAFDAANQNSTGSNVTSLNTNSITLGENAAFAVTLMSKDSAKSSPSDPDPTSSWSDGFSVIVQDWFASSGKGEPGFCVGARTLSATGTLSSTFSHDGSADQLACGIVSFTETGGSGGGSFNAGRAINSNQVVQ